jgi:hypothetical protein
MGKGMPYQKRESRGSKESLPPTSYQVLGKTRDYHKDYNNRSSESEPRESTYLYHYPGAYGITPSSRR